MAKGNMCFGVGDRIRINGRSYLVDGYINFLNVADDCNWTEYKLIDENNQVIKWLSVDIAYSEYALYTQSSSQVEQHIKQYGYKEVDRGTAKVMDFKGNVDVAYSDKVSFTEYEDATEEKIIGIEMWEDEVEYSTGYYLDEEEIERGPVAYSNVSNGNSIFDSSSNRSDYSSHNYSSNDYGRGNSVNFNPYRKIILFVAAFIGIGILISIAESIFAVNSHKKVDLSSAIQRDSRFTYVTSMTADIDNNQKADVYQVDTTVEDAAKIILLLAGESVENVDENAEDGSVAIITNSHYCLIYTSEENTTLVQVSTRKYVYSSRHRPYHSYLHTGSFYRSYYYTTGYNDDYNHYKGVNAFDDYTDGTVSTNSNNRYKQYSDTIKQESVAARQSSGGGTSSGK